MADLSDKNSGFEYTIEQISLKKVAYEDKLKKIKALETETTALTEEIESKTKFEVKLKEELLMMKSKHKANNRDLLINNDDLKYEYAKLDSDIEEIIQIIKTGRKREIELLEEVENEERRLQMLKDRGSALYLYLQGKNPGNADLEIRLNQEVGQTYDEKLSKILKKNIELKSEKIKLQDMILLMKEMKVDKQVERRYAREMVDSKIDSFSMLGDQTSIN